MSKKEFVMRGQTPSGETELLNFGGYKPGYAYKLVELSIYPSKLLNENAELAITLTAAKTYEDPSNPNFENPGLIGVSMLGLRSDFQNGVFLDHTIINNTFLITQDLILAAVDTETTAPMAINWQCRFEAVKMSGPEEAATNFKQFTIFDG